MLRAAPYVRIHYIPHMRVPCKLTKSQRHSNSAFCVEQNLSLAVGVVCSCGSTWWLIRHRQQCGEGQCRQRAGQAHYRGSAHPRCSIRCRQHGARGCQAAHCASKQQGGAGRLRCCRCGEGYWSQPACGRAHQRQLVPLTRWGTWKQQLPAAGVLHMGVREHLQ